MSGTYTLSGAAAIVGVGSSAYGRFPERSALSLGVEALKNAVSDAGLRRQDIDAFVTNVGYPMGVDYDQFCAAAGLNTSLNLQTWTHGRWVGTLVEYACAVATGLAACVAIVCVNKFTVFQQIGGAEDHEASREGGGSHGEVPHIGLFSPGSGAAMSARLYMERYGATERDLSVIPVAFRENAQSNPAAYRREALSTAEYLSSRSIIEPLRVHDFAQVTDGACAVLVMAAKQASVQTRRPVFVLGTQSIPAGRDEFIFGRPRLGVAQQEMGPFRPDERDLRVYERAGIRREEVDALYVYDAFSPLVWFTLERFGFCDEGEAAAYCRDTGIALDSPLPINTNGGLLAEAHVSGWNQVVEMVRQIRGEAERRQLANPELVQWATAFGDSFVLASDHR